MAALSIGQRIYHSWWGPLMLFPVAALLTAGASFIPLPENTVTSVQTAGSVISGRFLPGLLEDRTQIETDKGVYLVYGTLQMTKDDAVTFEEYRFGRPRLCVGEPKVCKALVR